MLNITLNTCNSIIATRYEKRILISDHRILSKGTLYIYLPTVVNFKESNIFTVFYNFMILYLPPK